MPKLCVSVKELRYNGRSMRYGEEFEASEKDAKVLKTIGKARDATEKPPLRVADPQPVRTAPRVQQQASMIAEGDPTPVSTGRRGRRYNRTDMQSED